VRPGVWLGVAVRKIHNLLDRLDELRYRRWAQSRSWRADKGVALVLVLGLALCLGVLAAMAVTRTDGGTISLAQSNAVRAPPSSRVDAGTYVITETVKHGDKTVRVLRRLAGDTTLVRTVPGAGGTVETIFQTQTVTTKEMATVTDVQQVTVTAPPETVTVVETVKCKPKEC
jgi:hypothetical protein